MNTFKKQCIDYLLVNEWIQSGDEWVKARPHNAGIYRANTIGRALNTQFDLEDEEPNPEPEE